MAETFSDRSALQAHQLARLSQLLETVLANNLFYRQKLSPAIGKSISLNSLEEFFDLVPFTTKDELVADHQAHPPYGSNLTFPVDRYTRCHQTSGSTGQPMRWLDTNESWNGLLESWMEVYHAAQVGAEDRIYFAF